MKPIKLYFAGSTPPKSTSLLIKNRLISYAYSEQVNQWFEATQGAPGNMIVDSGAFSAWNKGRVIDIDAYIAFAHSVIENGEKQGKKIFVVNLDVIPGKPGETKNLNKIIGDSHQLTSNKELIEISAKQGYQNLKIMVSNGIKPIHVFHQGENFKWVDRMIQYTDYIGISPANDMPVNSKKNWVTSVFEYLHFNKINVDTHGFAVWIPSLMKDLPWTSCDAATWRLVAGWGGIYYPIGGISAPLFSEENINDSFTNITVSEKRSSKGMKNLTSNMLKSLEKDGYTFEMLQDNQIRAELNVKFFLALEKWLNEYKAKNEYAPTVKFF